MGYILHRTCAKKKEGENFILTSGETAIKDWDVAIDYFKNG